MQGSQRVIDALNAGLTIELTAINQYFVQAKMCQNWGLMRLFKHHYHESIDEMKHAELLIDRIIFLEGVPEIARYDVIRVGSDVKEQLQNALALEVNASKTYNEGCRLCQEEKDAASREIMEKIIRESEESIDWLEAQLDLIEKLGIQNYMLSQVGEGEDGGH
jgi:bacterioferritin